jgi:hypothetical protein
VRMQQGRVQVDADWNEQVDIESYRDQTTTGDIIGPSGVPEQNGSFPGFKIGVATNGVDLTIGKGRYYVNGVLVENDGDTTYPLQPDYPNAPTPSAGRYLVYLDVWQRHITALEDQTIKEIALGGPDTATRTKTVWQVKLMSLPSSGTIDCSTQIGDFDNLSNVNLFGKLTARATPQSGNDPNNPCILPPTAGYTGLENQLYRVEIHRAGTYFKGQSSPPPPPTYKWSRENGAIVVSIEQLVDQGGGAATQVRVSSLGKDDVSSFKVGDYVEILDDANELNGTPGDLRKITNVDQAQRVLTLESSITIATYSMSRHPKVRRWEKIGTSMPANGYDVSRPDTNDGFIALEDGVEILFGDGIYNTGDYWMIPARTDTGTVEWPVDDDDAPLAQSRQGIVHGFAKLALGTYNPSSSPKWSGLTDCRKKIYPLTDLATDFYYVSGDGQNGLPGQSLLRPLQVGVANREAAIAGARVKFTVTIGTGTITADTGYASQVVSDGIIVFTNSGGIASCNFVLDSVAGDVSQQVTATLLDGNNNPLTYPPVRFNAQIPTAADVTYTPPADCTKLVGVSTVKGALDQLCHCECDDCDPTIQIVNMMFVAGPPLFYGAMMPFPLLQQGIRIMFNQAVDPITLNELGFMFYIYLPFLYGCQDCANTWYPAGVINNSNLIGYTPLLVESDIVVENPQQIVWKPKDTVFTNMLNVLSQSQFPSAAKMMTRLIMKGNYIWGPGMAPFLGGRVIPTPGGIKFPIADDCVGGNDIEIRFWTVPPPPAEQPPRVTSVTADPTPDLPCNTPLTVHAYFDQPLTPGSTVDITVTLVSGDGTALPATIQLTVDSTGRHAYNTAPVTPGVPSTNTVFKLAATVGGATASTTINAYPCPTIIECYNSVSSNGISGGSSFNQTVTVSRPFTVDTDIPFTTNNTSIVPNFTVHFPAGASTVVKSVPTNVFEGTDPVQVAISTTFGHTVPCTGVQINPRKSIIITSFTIDKPEMYTGDTATGTVCIDRVAPTGGIDVNILHDKDVVTFPGLPIPPVVHFAPTDGLCKTFTIHGESVTGPYENTIITAQYLGSQIPVPLRINAPQQFELLKVIGAEVVIFDGDHIIGSPVPVNNVQTTVVVPRQQMYNAIHVTFNQTPDTTVSSGSAMSTVNSKTFRVFVGGTSSPIPPLQILQLGSTDFILQFDTGLDVGPTYDVYLYGSANQTNGSAVITRGGQALDGNPYPESGPGIPSGDGNAGGDFKFSFKFV